MNLKRIVSLLLTVVCAICLTTGCGGSAVESNLPEETLETAAEKLAGTWKPTGLWAASLGRPSTVMTIKVTSSGVVTVNLNNVWLNRAWRSDDNARITTFERNGSQTGYFYYKGNFVYHQGMIEYNSTIYTNKAMDRVTLTTLQYKK